MRFFTSGDSCRTYHCACGMGARGQSFLWRRGGPFEPLSLLPRCWSTCIFVLRTRLEKQANSISFASACFSESINGRRNDWELSSRLVERRMFLNGDAQASGGT